ncbi:type I-U CRISPR-associated RAMP protein Csb1/Cas7u [Aromatoleum toluolicum]|uniref:Type I-U CRISPR-associated protein Cas7 n=1 Tax=Aromatoleum toluolicum TaxID=90060 RepID=A0ABX1NA74_9RHOO|nr:type I-U CRISPR-associated RAMP protein Csb1/Cas7u [Aromatoleum toluolicum]NMF96139.1 type I-U CRISPR-associated RAMP protein Csb1/Cas7u [Aromatoleum toluolicum]
MATEPSDRLNALLLDRNAVAIVCRQPLESVEGPGGVVFPPTYAGKGDNAPPEYNISDFGDGRNVCTMDSVQSQANRIEAAFLTAPYRALVREVTVRAELADGEQRIIDVLEAPHRLADATIRFSDLRQDAERAFRNFRDAPRAVAELSPMSLLMGAFDSRGTYCKIPRALTARIEAHNVRRLVRRALYSAALTGKDLGHEDSKLSQIGLDNALDGPIPGGIIADGGIWREAVLNLIALRQNCGQRVTNRYDEKPSKTPPDDLSAYIFGLGLVSLTLQPETFLRQGCLLVAAAPVAATIRYADGAKTSFSLSTVDALEFAKTAALRFGVASLPPRQGHFQRELIDEANRQAQEKNEKKKVKGNRGA